MSLQSTWLSTTRVLRVHCLPYRDQLPLQRHRECVHHITQTHAHTSAMLLLTLPLCTVSRNYHKVMKSNVTCFCRFAVDSGFDLAVHHSPLSYYAYKSLPHHSLYRNYPKVATPSPVAVAAPTEAPAVPTHPLPSGIPAQLPSSTAPPPPAVAQPSPHPPATPIHPTLRFSNEVMMNLLSNRAALMNMLQPYQQPSTSWANLTMAPPTPSTPPTVPGSLQSHQPPPKPTPSTQPIGMPLLPASVVLQRTGRVTARVVGPAPAPVSQCTYTSCPSTSISVWRPNLCTVSAYSSLPHTELSNERAKLRKYRSPVQR